MVHQDEVSIGDRKLKKEATVVGVYSVAVNVLLHFAVEEQLTGAETTYKDAVSLQLSSVAIVILLLLPPPLSVRSIKKLRTDLLTYNLPPGKFGHLLIT